MKEVIKEYTNGEITVVWKPKTCIHSENCIQLSSVFNQHNRPWINPEGASSDRIASQIDKCPSGALSYYYNGKENEEKPDRTSDIHIQVTPSGPLLIPGTITVKHKDGREETREKMTALCRCGASGNKPFCDGSHHKVGFEDA